MFGSLYRLLTRDERLSLFKLLPWVIGSALVEIVGVAAVVPFLSLLADPDSIVTIPVIGSWLSSLEVEPLTLLRWLGLGVAVAVILVNLMVTLTTWQLMRFSWRLNHTISSRLLRHYLTQPYAFLLTRNSADLANKTTEQVYRITQDGFGAAVDLIARSVAAAAIVAFLIYLDPVLAFYAFVTLVGAYGLIYVTTKQFVARIGREATKLNTTRLRVVNEAMGGFKELKVSGREHTALEQYLAPSKRYADVRAIYDALGALPRFALEAIAVGGMILLASLMAGRSGTFSSTLPLLGAYAFGGLRLMPALQGIFSSLTRIRFSLGAIEAVEEDFAAASELGADLRSTEVERLHFNERIDLRSITFQYPTASKPALVDVNLTIPKRGNVALIGRTGSGKTTLADVILGLLHPDAGHVEVDGELVGPHNIMSYRRIFGYVPQSIFVTDGSILENVAFGVPQNDIDREAVQRACEAAQIHEFITTELPEGYATVVGERGIRLSGGQRQRIGIARALYSDPPVLIFDEATSALDVHTEQAVYSALDAIAETRTVITIAHRLETIANAHQVVVLEQGQVKEIGTPADVLTRYRGNESPADVFA